jgi:hypothetical protein
MTSTFLMSLLNCAMQYNAATVHHYVISWKYTKVQVNCNVYCTPLLHMVMKARV